LNQLCFIVILSIHAGDIKAEANKSKEAEHTQESDEIGFHSYNCLHHLLVAVLDRPSDNIVERNVRHITFLPSWSNVLQYNCVNSNVLQFRDQSGFVRISIG
jgi:hypothetical protein